MLNAGPGGRARLHEMLREEIRCLSIGAPPILPEDLGAIAAAAEAAADANHPATTTSSAPTAMWRSAPARRRRSRSCRFSEEDRE
jgi:hypothetical protein